MFKNSALDHIFMLMTSFSIPLNSVRTVKYPVADMLAMVMGQIQGMCVLNFA